MTEGSGFVCVECGARVSSLSYRSSCPECAGSLEPHTQRFTSDERVRRE